MEIIIEPDTGQALRDRFLPEMAKYNAIVYGESQPKFHYEPVPGAFAAQYERELCERELRASTKTLSGPDVAAIARGESIVEPVSAAERLEHQLFTADEVREIAFQVAASARRGWVATVLREHGISAESPSQPVPQPPTPAPQPPPPGA